MNVHKLAPVEILPTRPHLYLVPKAKKPVEYFPVPVFGIQAFTPVYGATAFLDPNQRAIGFTLDL